MRVTSNSNSYVYEYKKPNETQSRFVDILAEMKLVSNGDNRLNVRLTPSREPSDESDTRVEKKTSTYKLGENGLPVGMVRLEDCEIYEAPETPELLLSVHEPTHLEQRLSGFFLGMMEDDVNYWLRNLTEEAASADYTGMSKGEIYESILKRYEEALGEGFLDVSRLHIVTGTSAYGRVADQFYSELKAQFGSLANVETVIREHLYGNMTNDEIQDAIRAKYPKDLTNRDLFLMMAEMDEVGAVAVGVVNETWLFLESYVGDYCFEVNGGIGTVETHDFWVDSLDKPINVQKLINNYNANKLSQFPESFKPASMLLDFTLKYFDVHMTADGFLALGASRTDLINKLLNR